MLSLKGIVTSISCLHPLCQAELLLWLYRVGSGNWCQNQVKNKQNDFLCRLDVCQHKQLSQHSRRIRNRRWRRIGPLGVNLRTCRSVEGSGRNSVVTGEVGVGGGKVSVNLLCAILFPSFCASVLSHQYIYRSYQICLSWELFQRKWVCKDCESCYVDIIFWAFVLCMEPKFIAPEGNLLTLCFFRPWDLLLFKKWCVLIHKAHGHAVYQVWHLSFLSSRLKEASWLISRAEFSVIWFLVLYWRSWWLSIPQV